MKKKTKIALFTTLAAVVVLIAVFLGILFGTDVIQMGLIRAVCPDEAGSVPENYDEIVANTTLTTYRYRENLDLDVIEPVGGATSEVVYVVFHGGYYVGGGRHNQEPYARLIASKGFRVVNADYTLAPEKAYPAQLLDANAALNFADELFENASFVLSGDSAGAHLAAQLSAMIGDTELRASVGEPETIGRDRLAGFVGNCGFYEASTVEESGFFMIGSAMRLLTGVRNYRNDPRIAELDLLERTGFFPPSLLIAGDQDPFLAQNIEMRDALDRAGIRVESYFPTTEENALGHELHCNYKIKESGIATERIVGFLKSVDRSAA